MCRKTRLGSHGGCLLCSLGEYGKYLIGPKGLELNQGKAIPAPTAQSGKLAPLPDNPFVTVVVNSYNQGGFIEDTILSVLNQDYDPIELIVIDGGSTDDTLEVLRRHEKNPRLRWVSEPDDGPNTAWNKGLRLATGDLLGLQTSSDPYYQGAIRAAVQEFQADAAVALVGAATIRIDVAGRPMGNRYYYPQGTGYFSLDSIVKFVKYPPLQASL